MNLKFWKWRIKKNDETGNYIVQIKDEYVFPCAECIALPGRCRQLCDKVAMEDSEVKKAGDRANEGKEHLTCPDCGGQEWYDGPSGGMSENIKCGKCGHWFNFGGPFGFTERIHVGKDGRVYD